MDGRPPGNRRQADEAAVIKAAKVVHDLHTAMSKAFASDALGKSAAWEARHGHGCDGTCQGGRSERQQRLESSAQMPAGTEEGGGQEVERRATGTRPWAGAPTHMCAYWASRARTRKTCGTAL
jgi:hypothetical protein